MDTDDSTPPTEPLDLRKLSAQEAPTVNQLVAYNMTRARRSRGWTQQEVADRLEKYTGRSWSKASISAAERSWQGGRPRKFDADEMLALAVIFDTPIAYFFLPMDEGNVAIAMSPPEDQHDGGAYWVGVRSFLQRVLMDGLATKGGSEFFVRAHAAAQKHMDVDWNGPVFLEKRPGGVFPPGYRFGDPLEEEYLSDQDIEDAEEAAAQEEERQTSDLERALSPLRRKSLLRAHAKEISLEIAKHLDRMGYLQRDSESGEWGKPGGESQTGESGKYDEEPPF